MTITKKRAAKCVTHHQACDCREYRYQEMEATLRVILTWASFHYHKPIANDKEVFRHINNAAAKALGREDLIEK